MRSDRTSFLVHRLTSGRAVSYVLLATIALSLVGMARHHQMSGQWGTVAWMLAATAVVYVLGLRPALVEAPVGLEVRNPLRTTLVPWDALSGVDVADVLRLHTGAGEVRCFAVPRRRPTAGTRSPSAATFNYSLPPIEPGAGWQPPKGQPRAEALAERLRDLREEYRGVGGGPVVTRWAGDAVGALVLAGLLVLVALALQ